MVVFPCFTAFGQIKSKSFSAAIAVSSVISGASLMHSKGFADLRVSEFIIIVLWRKNASSTAANFLSATFEYERTTAAN